MQALQAGIFKEDKESLSLRLRELQCRINTGSQRVRGQGWARVGTGRMHA